LLEILVEFRSLAIGLRSVTSRPRVLCAAVAAEAGMF
jgi:hypothetical protein